MGGIARQNLPIAFSLTGPVDASRVRAALQEVVATHGALRTGFREVDEGLRPFVVPEVVVELAQREAVGAPVSRLLRELVAGMSDPMDLDCPPLLTGCLVRYAPDAYLLLLAANHLILDGNCYALLFRALVQAYAGQPLSRPRTGWRFEDFGHTQAQCIQSPGVAAYRQQLGSWLERYMNDARTVVLPTRDVAAPPFHRHTARLTEALVGGESTLFHILLGSFQLAYHDMCQAPVLLTEVTVSGRTRPEHVEMIGPLMTDVIVVTERTGNESVLAFLERSESAWQRQIVAHLDSPISTQVLTDHEQRSGRLLVLPCFNLIRQELAPPCEALGVSWSMLPPEQYLTTHRAETAGLVALTVLVDDSGDCHLEFTGRDDVVSHAELRALAIATCQNAQALLYAGHFVE